MIEYASGKEYCHDLSEYIPLYDETSEIRNNYLLLLKYSSYISEEAKIISEFFETTLNSVNQINTTKSQIVIIRIHELFIYTIAFFINNHQYNSVGYILGKTYFSNSKVYNADGVDSFKMFYSAINHTDLDRAICKRDDKNYHSGTAHYWMETIATECCTKEQFVLADLICFNYSIYGNYIRDHWCWFPITYAYDSHFYSCLSFIGKKLVSQEFVLEILPLFGYDSFDAFVTEYKKQEELIQTGSLTNYKYSGGFERPYLLRDFTKPENVGKYR